MGMVKSAARMLLSSGHDTDSLLPRLQEVLYPLKGPDMFVTACFLTKDGACCGSGLHATQPFCIFLRRPTKLHKNRMPKPAAGHSSIWGFR
jgi:hypothetical protein